jgi:hypothetical protein
MSLQFSNCFSEELPNTLTMKAPRPEAFIPLVVRQSQRRWLRDAACRFVQTPMAAMKKWKFPPAFSGEAPSVSVASFC